MAMGIVLALACLYCAFLVHRLHNAEDKVESLTSKNAQLRGELEGVVRKNHEFQDLVQKQNIAINAMQETYSARSREYGQEVLKLKEKLAQSRKETESILKRPYDPLKSDCEQTESLLKDYLKQANG